jgi:small subunit ribosomal protein S4
MAMGCAACRRAGEKLFLKGERCFSPKCALTRRGYAPGQHGAKGSGRRSEYGTQLAEKQKVKRIYGLRERQFRKYYEAATTKEGVTGNIVLTTLERRLDNVVYRLGLAGSRRDARQLVSHKHFQVNGRTVNIPSFQVKAGDVVSVKANSLATPSFQLRMKKLESHKAPAWLEFDLKNASARVMNVPEITDVDHQPQMQLIVEFYSR